MSNSFVSADELSAVAQHIGAVRALAAGQTFFVDTYGCQQNEADSETMRGMLRDMGYAESADDRADVIVINTCAIREGAEQRVFGNIGHLIHRKRENPNCLIVVAGCMAGEAHVRERIAKSYRHVDALLDTASIWKLPETILALLTSDKKRVACELSDAPDIRIPEGLPKLRKYQHKAWVSIMYGCDNFCSYCIVPHVRGRERSRKSADILREIEELVAGGCKDITLLGQNVNSYGKGLSEDIDFAGLLTQIDRVQGDYLVRFMTSHPKDAGRRLIDVMAASEHVAPALHLPVQSGSDRVLDAMNRRYTATSYLDLVRYAKERIPGIALTSDIIVGFPGETEDDFEKTLALVETARYDALFTFLFSPRKGTPAASLPDETTETEKKRRFDRLVALQNDISAEKHALYVGQTLRVLVDGPGREAGSLDARTAGGRLVHLRGDASLIGSYQMCRITGASTWSLAGELAGA